MSDVASIHAEGAGTIPENTGTPEGAELDTAAADHFASRRDAGVDDFGGGAPGDEFGIEGLESLPADEQDRVRRSVAGKNNELVAERKRLERERTQMEAARLAYENAMRQQPAAEEPTVQEKPVFQEGEDPTAFMERLTDWKLNQKLNELGLNETQQTVDSLKRGSQFQLAAEIFPNAYQKYDDVQRFSQVLEQKLGPKLASQFDAIDLMGLVLAQEKRESYFRNRSQSPRQQAQKPARQPSPAAQPAIQPGGANPAATDDVIPKDISMFDAFQKAKKAVGDTSAPGQYRFRESADRG